MFTNLELSELCLQLNMYIESGIPIDEGFRSMSDVDGKDKELYKTIADKIEEGNPLHEVLEETKAFPDYMVKMCKLGQETGNLGVITKDLAYYYESQHLVMTNIKNAVHYPFIMMSMLLVIVTYLFKKVLPTFDSIYSSFGMAVSNTMRYRVEFAGNICLGLLFVIATCVVCYIVFSLTNKGVDASEVIFKKLFKNSKVMLAFNNQRLAMALGMCLRGGFDFERSLGLASMIIDNDEVKGRLNECVKCLTNGDSIYDSIIKSNLFVGHSAQLIKAGVQSGHLDEVMSNLARTYGQEASNKLDVFMGRIEPSIVILLTVSVGAVLFSVMLPLARLLESIGV